MIVFLVLFLLNGCVPQGISDEQPILSDLQKRYYNLNDDELNSMRVALASGSMEECRKIMEGEETNPEKIELVVRCSGLLTKVKAFNDRDYKLCRELYNAEDTENYEQCIAPLIAESAIVFNEPTYCGKYLTIPELVAVCGEQYENESQK